MLECSSESGEFIVVTLYSIMISIYFLFRRLGRASVGFVGLRNAT